MRDWQRIRFIAWIIDRVIDLGEKIFDAVSEKKRSREAKERLERDEQERWIRDAD